MTVVVVGESDVCANAVGMATPQRSLIALALVFVSLVAVRVITASELTVLGWE